MRFRKRSGMVRRMAGCFDFLKSATGTSRRTTDCFIEFLVGHMGRTGAGDEDAAALEADDSRGCKGTISFDGTLAFRFPFGERGRVEDYQAELL